MFGSWKTIPELKDLPAAERKRALRGGARYALNRLPFLFIVLCMIVGMSVFQVYVIYPLVPSELGRFAVLAAFFYVFSSIFIRIVIHYARPYWRQLHKRDG
jgi:cytochrome b subunit of formate dehydrogenase